MTAYFLPLFLSIVRRCKTPKPVSSLCGPRLGLLELHSAERNRRALFQSLSLRFANFQIPESAGAAISSPAHEGTATFSLEHTITGTVCNRACSMAVLDIFLASPSGSDHRRDAAMDLRLPRASRSRELLSWRRTQRADQFSRSNMKRRPPLSR